jgi:class 3 adenylate cyclase
MRFDPIASLPRNGIALIYDLAGFSHFFNQPDAQEYVPKFLNHVSEALSIALNGGECYWSHGEKFPALMPPVYEKFLGDGALYVWTPSEGQSDFDPDFVILLCNRLWNLKNAFATHVVPRAADDVPIVDRPTKIRFGLARSTVLRLAEAESSRTEYIGFCLNLASRLQSYCPELGFIASARLGLPEKSLADNGYIKVIATSIRGFPAELVVVDKQEFANLPRQIKDKLFTARTPGRRRQTP